MRRITVWERAATETLTKKTIAKGSYDIIPNYVAGGMNATEGAYVWNYTVRNCPEEGLEELYKGKLGILDDGVVTQDEQWPEGLAETGKGSDHMQQKDAPDTPSARVEWNDHQRVQGVTKRYTAPLEERELESMRLEWSYLRGRDDYMLRRDFQDATTKVVAMQPDGKVLGVWHASLESVT